MCHVNVRVGEPRGSFGRPFRMEAAGAPLYSGHFVLLPSDHPKGMLAPASAVPAGDPRAETLAGKAAAAAAEKLSQLEALQRGQGVVSPIKESKAEEGEHVPAFNINTRSSAQPS